MDWTALEALPRPTLAELFADGGRVAALSAELAIPGGAIRFDWSKTHLDETSIDAFIGLAEQANFAAKRAALFGGEIVNASEHRAATHTAQRGVGDAADVDEAQALHQRMRALVEAIRGFDGEGGALGEVKSLIHIGIGGSALGPALAIDALTRDGADVAVHVVANIDGLALEEAVAQCDPATTLIAVASKTFTTTETLTNAASALDWLRAGGVDDPHGRVVALTAFPEKAVEWGVDETRVLPFPDTVGGRYSLWSSIGFPICLALGWEAFAQMLEGGAAVDRHFRDSDGIANLPLRAAFADLYYTQVRGCQTRAVFAYDERLRLLPSYLQQLEMESNGKSVTADGAPLGRPSAPVTWGGVGTDAQHAVFQLLHRGTQVVPVEFVAVREGDDRQDPEHHRLLLLNAFAQGAALMTGHCADDPQRSYGGDRPSLTILLERLDARSLGALIAFYEHRTFANAVLLGINPFDQFGVELGKEIATRLANGEAADDLDPSTRALIERAGL
jgi:glucose-6-phosphate isomerase